MRLALTEARRAALTPATRRVVEDLERAAAEMRDVFYELDRWLVGPGFDLGTYNALAVLLAFKQIAEFAPENDLIRDINMDLALCRQGFKDGRGAML